MVNRPSVAGIPRLGLELKPNKAAVDASAAPFSRCVASVMKVELQDTANAVCRLVAPRCSLSKLWKTRPPTFTCAGHWTLLAGRSPVPLRAEAVTTLNVEPGGNTPWSARSNPPGRSMTASTRPVDGWRATRSTGRVVVAALTAADAASWSCMTMLVLTGVPGPPGRWATARLLPGPWMRMVTAGLPASCCW